MMYAIMAGVGTLAHVVSRILPSITPCFPLNPALHADFCLLSKIINPSLPILLETVMK